MYVCMYVHVCMYIVCTYVYCTMHVCTYACMYVIMYLCMYYTHTYILHVHNTYTYIVCMYISMYVYVLCTCTCNMYVLCLYICMYVCMYVCMYLYMCTRLPPFVLCLGMHDINQALQEVINMTSHCTLVYLNLFFPVVYITLCDMLAGCNCSTLGSEILCG